MAFSGEKLVSTFVRTDGDCHLCGMPLVLKQYGRLYERGAWEVDHSVPRSRGGTDHGNNLYAACVGCNRAKGARSTRSVRAANGMTRAPLSTVQFAELAAYEAGRTDRAVVGFVGAGLAARALGATPAAQLGWAVVGALFGSSI